MPISMRELASMTEFLFHWFAQRAHMHWKSLMSIYNGLILCKKVVTVEESSADNCIFFFFFLLLFLFLILLLLLRFTCRWVLIKINQIMIQLATVLSVIGFSEFYWLCLDFDVFFYSPYTKRFAHISIFLLHYVFWIFLLAVRRAAMFKHYDDRVFFSRYVENYVQQFVNVQQEFKLIKL